MYGHVAHLGLLHLEMIGDSLILLVKQALVRMDLSDGLCRLLLMIWEFSKTFFMHGSASMIGRLFLIIWKTSGFLGLCVETYDMTQFLDLFLTFRRSFLSCDFALLIPFSINFLG